jgi:hypothetical protein
MKSSIAIMAGAALLLTACGSATTASRSGQRPVTAGMRPATNDHRGTPAPVATGQAGDLLGRDRAGLVALFGNPRLDTQDGAATRLQFSSDRCVLDAYLYAQRSGAQPTVTHVDARTPDGADADRGDCIAALRRR